MTGVDVWMQISATFLSLPQVNMDKYIDAHFERLEKALTTFIDSITKYHPSLAQAEELKAADLELSKGLEEVQTHQNNHLRIQQLRQLSATLDAQVRETLTSLANTRKDIVTTQTTTYPPGVSYPIAYEELLGYSRRISKTSMPPAATLNTASPALPAPETTSSQTPLPDSNPQSAVTPSAPTPNLTQSPAPTANGASSSQPGAEPSATQQTQQTTTSSNISLPEGMTQYLNPLSGQPFFPWPLEDKIRSGALASNQMLAEQGIDPKGYDPVLEEDRKRREEEDRKEREEREKHERAERERKMREEMERLRLEREREQAEWRRASAAAGAPDGPGSAKVGGAGTGEKKQFQFTNLDDLDDDDDD